MCVSVCVGSGWLEWMRRTFEEPGSSVAAQLLALLSVIFVIISMVMLCMSTLPDWNTAKHNTVEEHRYTHTHSQKRMHARKQGSLNISRIGVLVCVSVCMGVCVMIVGFSVRLIGDNKQPDTAQQTAIGFNLKH